MKKPKYQFHDGDTVDYHSIIGGPITSPNCKIVGEPFIASDRTPVAFIDKMGGYVAVAALTPAINEPEIKLIPKEYTNEELAEYVDDAADFIEQAIDLTGRSESAIDCFNKDIDALRTAAETLRKLPKFQIGDEVWHNLYEDPTQGRILFIQLHETHILYTMTGNTEKNIITRAQDFVFATSEEAEAAAKEDWRL